jgi:hypothetical protein
MKNLAGLGALVLVAFSAGYSGSRFHDAVSAADTPTAISAHTIRIVDNQGVTRLAMGANDANHSVSLNIFDPDGTTTRLIIGLRPDGNATMEFRDSSGNKRADFVSEPAGESRLSISDQAMQGGLVLGSSGGQSALIFNDDQPKSRALFGIKPSGNPALTIADKEGKSLFEAPKPATP